MFQSRSDYDRGVNTFSPEGRIFQIEYAMESVKHGSTAVGIKTNQGVVLGAERRVTSPLLEPSSVQKAQKIDTHIGCVMSGFVADSRTLVEHARVEAQNYRFTYGEPIRGETCTFSICDLSLQFGEGGKKVMSRPFGVSFLIGCVDDHGPALWHTDPSGTYSEFSAKAVGAGADGAQTMLTEQYHKSITLEEAKILVVKILKQVMEEKLTSTNIEISEVKVDDKKFRMLEKQEIDSVIEKIA
jgi:20S proteasome subunit alpha 5